MAADVDARRRRHVTPYTDVIKRLAPDHDPRHVEAFIRIAHPTMDHLTYGQLAREVAIAVMCIETEGKEFAEKVALSYGL